MKPARAKAAKPSKPALKAKTAQAYHISKLAGPKPGKVTKVAILRMSGSDAPSFKRIATIRTKARLSRPKFARLTGFSERALANWESGKQDPDAATTRRLREVDRLFDALARVMTHDAIATWIDTPNPAFDNLKPLEVIERGQLDRLWRMIFELESGIPT